MSPVSYHFRGWTISIIKDDLRFLRQRTECACVRKRHCVSPYKSCIVSMQTVSALKNMYSSIYFKSEAKTTYLLRRHNFTMLLSRSAKEVENRYNVLYRKFIFFKCWIIYMLKMYLRTIVNLIYNTDVLRFI